MHCHRRGSVHDSDNLSSIKGFIDNTIGVTSGRILLAPTGDACVCLDMELHLRKGHCFQTLYAFVVSAEATLVFLLLNVVLGTILALLLRL